VIVNKLSIAQSYSRRYFETRLQVVDSAAALSFGEGQGISYTGSTPAVSYTYDWGTNQKGFRTGMSDGSGSAAWTSNAMGWPVTERRTIKVGTSNITNTISYSYNQDGSLASITYPSGRTITYSTSNAQRVVSAKDVANSIQYAMTASYAPPGELNSVFYGPASGIKEQAAYNSRLEITSTSATVGSTTEQGLGFNYLTGNNGMISSTTNSMTTGLGESFTYDSLNRILTAGTTATTGSGCWGQSFGPAGPPPPGPPDDRWSNLTQINATQCTVGSLSVTANTATNQISTTGYGYDASGNMTSEGPPTGYTYQFDAENHLTQASGMSPGPWTYVYDGNGLRVQKSTSTSNGTLYWRAIAGQTIAETDTTGNTTNAAYHEYIFFSGERIASRTGTGAVNYTYFDQVGSTVTITDGSGNPCYQATFTPYGQEEPTQSACSSNYKFTGYERDTETGLDYAFARFYDPRLGRFMSPDPLGGDLTDPQSLNRYAYVDNNPSNFVDPMGLYKYCPNIAGCTVGGTGNPNSSSGDNWAGWGWGFAVVYAYGFASVGDPSAESTILTFNSVGINVYPTGPNNPIIVQNWTGNITSVTGGAGSTTDLWGSYDLVGSLQIGNQTPGVIGPVRPQTETQKPVQPNKPPSTFSKICGGIEAGAAYLVVAGAASNVASTGTLTGFTASGAAAGAAGSTELGTGVLVGTLEVTNPIGWVVGGATLLAFASYGVCKISGN
jgi:RHS repeat-associated protein